MASYSKRYNFGKEGISVDFFHKLTANFGNQLLIREKWANKIVLEIFAQVPINFACLLHNGLLWNQNSRQRILTTYSALDRLLHADQRLLK